MIEAAFKPFETKNMPEVTVTDFHRTSPDGFARL